MRPRLFDLISLSVPFVPENSMGILRLRWTDLVLAEDPKSAVAPVYAPAMDVQVTNLSCRILNLFLLERLLYERYAVVSRMSEVAAVSPFACLSWYRITLQLSSVFAPELFAESLITYRSDKALIVILRPTLSDSPVPAGTILNDAVLIIPLLGIVLALWTVSRNLSSRVGIESE